MSTEALLKERQSTHGEYKEHARCTQAIMRAVMTERNWQGDRLSDIQRESLHMFAHKMGRIAVGNPDEPDHWKDIAGYAVLVEQRLAPPKPSPLQEQTMEAMMKRASELPQNRFKIPDSLDTRHCTIEQLPEEFRQRTPEDGAQHASVTPWVVTADWLGRQEIDTPLIDAFWTRRGEHYVLEPHVASHNIPRVLRSCYNMDMGGGWTLDIRRCPEDVRECFPNLYREKNMMEWEQLPEWQRALYMWQEHPQKYVLGPYAEAWHVEAA